MLNHIQANILLDLQKYNELRIYGTSTISGRNPISNVAAQMDS
jgi:hypothetical protein